MNHCWVASLANYNFQLYYRAGKTNIDADALLRVSWPWCVPNTFSMHHWVTTAAVWTMQEATIGCPTSPIEAYSCDLYILGLVGDGPQVTYMTTNVWQQAKQTDPILGHVIARMQEGTLGQCQYKPADPPELWQLLWECNHLKLRWGILYRKILPKEFQEALFQLVLPSIHWETTLRGCQDKIGQLGLKRMLDLMCNHFFWTWMAVQVKEHVKKCCKCITSRQSNTGPPLRVLWLPIPGASAHWVPVPGAREGKGREHLGSNRLLHPLCLGICHLISDGLDNGQGPLGQFHCPLQVTRENPFGPGEEFWEWANSWPLQINWDQETQNQPISHPDKWPVQKVELHPNQHAWALPWEHKSDSKGSIGVLVHAYNCTHNSVIGCSPYFLMYCR